MKTQTEGSRQKVFAELLLMLLLLPVVVVIFNLLGMIVKRPKKKRTRQKSENFGVAYFWEALSYLSLLVKFMLRSKRFIC